jgi:glycolate oxidase iron-sulfur subunit
MTQVELNKELSHEKSKEEPLATSTKSTAPAKSANPIMPTAPITPNSLKDKRISLKELVLLLKELDNLLVTCMRCGFCQSVCPVYGATFREADVTRGKIALLEDLASELTKDAIKVNEKLCRCLLCSSCESVCPSGVKIMDIFIRARAIATGYKGLGLIKKFIFRFLLPRPRLFNHFIFLSSIFQNLFLRKENPENTSLRTSSLPLLSPILGDRHIPSIPGESFSFKYGEIDEEKEASDIKILYFPGCVPDKLYSSISEATIKVLRHHKVKIYMPQDFVCCGIPLVSSGDRIGFLRLLTKNLLKMSNKNFDYLVTSCATCASTIKETWPRFKEEFGNDSLELIENISEKTHDITSFLVNILKVGFIPHKEPQTLNDNTDISNEEKKTSLRVTYHDPCHLRRALKVYKEPREILQSLSSYSYAEMPEAERCCGNGGSFNLAHYDLSKNIGKRKRDNIISVDPDVVATSCPACMLQLTDMLSRENDSVNVRHVIELYADSLGENTKLQENSAEKLHKRNE